MYFLMYSLYFDKTMARQNQSLLLLTPVFNSESERDLKDALAKSIDLQI